MIGVRKGRAGVSFDEVEHERQIGSKLDPDMSAA